MLALVSLAAVGLSASASLFVASATGDVTFWEWKTRSVFTGFESERCNGTARVSVDLPTDARYVEPVTMRLGKEVPAVDGFQASRGLARVTSTTVGRAAGGRRMTWVAMPTSSLCGRAAEVGTDLGWFTGWWTFRAYFAAPRLVRITRADFRGLARVALQRRYNSYGYSQGRRIRCDVPRRNWARCEVFFFGGDTNFRGYVVSRLMRTADRQGLLWYYRLRVVQTSEYCQLVTMNYPCSEVHRLRRSGLSTPGFVTATEARRR